MGYKKELISRNLRKFAEENYVTNSDFAEALQIKPQSLHKYLKGERIPGTEMIIKLINLGCDPSWLLTGKSIKNTTARQNAILIEFNRLKRENAELKSKIEAISKEMKHLISEFTKFEAKLKKL